MNRMSRRTVLRGLAGTSIALPWLESMDVRKAHAAPGLSDSGFPKRFIVWATCNGFHNPIWNPGGGETDFILRPVHKALEPFKKDLVIVAGLNDAAFAASHGDLHSRGMCTFMSGTESIVDSGANGGAFGGSSKASGGITLDQEIVKRLALRTRFPSIEMTFIGASTGPYGTTSYLDAAKPLPGTKDPSAVFNRIFAGGRGNGPAADPAAAARIQAGRRSILDGVGKTYQGLLPRLGVTDRGKVESHLTQIRDLEARLQVIQSAAREGGGGAGCPKMASAPAGSDRPAQAAAFVDLLATAVACDLTRVATMQWEMTTGNSVYSWLGIARGHHDMSHDGDDRADTVASLTKIHTFYAEQLARLVTRLKAIPEGNGTAFDNTIILHACDLGRGNNGHTGTNKFHMLLGRGGGALKNTGRVLRYSGDANNKLFVSILNMFDIPATTFGNPRLSSGPLPRI